MQADMFLDFGDDNQKIRPGQNQQYQPEDIMKLVIEYFGGDELAANMQYQPEDIMKSAIEYFGGDELAANIWINKYSFREPVSHRYLRKQNRRSYYITINTETGETIINMLSQRGLEEYWNQYIDNELEGCERWRYDVRQEKYGELRKDFDKPGFTEAAKKKVRGLLQDPLPDYMLAPLASPEVIDNTPSGNKALKFDLLLQEQEMEIEQKCQHFMDSLQPYGFAECKMVKKLNEQQLALLISHIVNNDVHYAIAMLVDVLEFDKYTKSIIIYNDNGKVIQWSLVWFCKLLRKAMPTFNIRAIEGNYRKLRNAAGNDIENRYRAKEYLNQVNNDYQYILKAAA